MNQAVELPIILKKRKPKVGTTVRQRLTTTPENKLNKRRKKQLWSVGLGHRREPHRAEAELREKKEPPPTPTH